MNFVPSLLGEEILYVSTPIRFDLNLKECFEQKEYPGVSTPIRFDLNLNSVYIRGNTVSTPIRFDLNECPRTCMRMGFSVSTPIRFDLNNLKWETRA